LDPQLNAVMQVEPDETRPEEQNLDQQIGAPENDQSVAAAEPTPRHSIFISHKRGFDLDQNTADKLFEDLRADHDLYLDTEQVPGTPYEKKIKESIKNADYVLALITDHSNASEWVKAEIEYAIHCRDQQGSPTIIPIHLDFNDTYDMRLAACLSGAQRIEWNSLADYSQLLEAVRAALKGGPRASVPTEILGMEGFLVRGSRKRRVFAAFLEVPETSAATETLKKASETLKNEKLLWVVGDAGGRNHVALSLAVRDHLTTGAGAAEGERIYEVTKSLSWSKVNNTMVRDSTIVFSNVLPAALFDVETPRDEFGSLERLLRRGNVVIVTTSEDSYADIEQEMRKREFERGTRLDVDRDFYDEGAKLRIFKKLVQICHEGGEINQKQHVWAQHLLGESHTASPSESWKGESRDLFLSILRKWSPADLERFITVHLPQAKKPDDIYRLLHRNADLENEIHGWFMGLDDSTRCFVLALAMFSGLGRRELWEKYKSIVQSLKKLDPSLSLWPLGICRQRAADYVTVDGPLDFVNETISEAIYREIAKNFREYFIELLPLMKTWSVPSGRDQRLSDALFEERRVKASQSKELRLAIARIVGIVSRFGLADVMSLLDYWATDPILAVREAFAVSLEQTAAEGTGARQALSLLDSWTNDTSIGTDTLFRVWAAAAALGNIVASKPGESTYRKALVQLETLALDTRRSVRFNISIPLKKAARRGLLSDIEKVLSATAQDTQATTKINVAEALNEARLFDEVRALEVLGKWSASQDANQRWATMCSLILWVIQSRRGMDRQITEVGALLEQDASTVAAVLIELIAHRLYQKKAVHFLKRFIDGTNEDMRQTLIGGLATIPFATLNEKVLPMLRASGRTEAENVVIGVRRESWKRELANPIEFINDLRESLDKEQTRDEVLRVLLVLLQGDRNNFKQAFVAAFPQNRTCVNELLEKLSQVAPPVFGPMSVEIRRDAFRSLFNDPLKFVQVVSENAVDAQTSAQTFEALDLLAQPAPFGYYSQLLQTITASYAHDAIAFNSLLALLRGEGRDVFRSLAYDVNRQLMEASLTQPVEFLSQVKAAMSDAGQRNEVIRILDALSDPGPQGNRNTLVHALAEAKVTHRLEVDDLLQNQWPQTQSALSKLRLEIRLASLLNSSLTPKFMSRLFNTKS
jgi:hypothetical protein